MDSPDVRYAQSGDAAIAYYTLGDGPRDLLFASFMLSSVFAWELLPVFRDFCSRLAEFSRLLVFDRRGLGASDRPRTQPTLEAHMEDKGFHLDNTLMSKIVRALVHYVEETQLHNLGAPEKRLKRSSQEAYVKAWEHRPHGDHDEAPPEWREYK